MVSTRHAHVSRRGARSRSSRRVSSALAVTVIASALSGAAAWVGAPAQATCIYSSEAFVNKVDSTKGLLSYKATGLASTSAALPSTNTVASSSTAWKGYTKVFGGGSGHI